MKNMLQSFHSRWKKLTEAIDNMVYITDEKTLVKREGRRERKLYGSVERIREVIRYLDRKYGSDD